MSYISIYLQFAFISISIYSLLLYQYLSTACFYISIYLQLAFISVSMHLHFISELISFSYATLLKLNELYQHLSTACFYCSLQELVVKHSELWTHFLQLNSTGYSGDAEEAFSYHHDCFFSTRDRENDNDPNRHCAALFTGNISCTLGQVIPRYEN